jgi:beta-phosphoglucomutase-like phosphatase (HAD superfamily)
MTWGVSVAVHLCRHEINDALIFDFDGIIIDSRVSCRFGKSFCRAWPGVGLICGLIWLAGQPTIRSLQLFSSTYQSGHRHRRVGLERRARVIALTEAQPVLPGVLFYAALRQWR